jgi:tyrosine-protein kinase Etk/Wzc
MPGTQETEKPRVPFDERLLSSGEHSSSEQRDVSVLDLLRVLGESSRFLLLFTGILTAISAVAVWLIPPEYKGEAVIMPPQQPQSSLSSFAAGALSMVAGGGMTSQLGLKSQTDLYIGVLKSRTIADSMIEQFGLRSVYKEPTLLDTRKALEKHVTIESGKDTLIHIVVEDRDPSRATGLANAFVDALAEQNSRLALTEASQRRLFFGQQLNTEKVALADAEVALKKNQETTGLVLPAGQGEALIRSTAQLRAELASREVELESLRTFATDQNPRVETAQREMDALRDQIHKLEASAGSEGIQVTANRLPAAELDYVRKLRNVKYHETLLELLAKQYEAAYIDEAKSAPVIQIVDRAIVPDKKSWPPRALFIAIAAVGSLFLAIVIALTRRHLQNSSHVVRH